MAWLFQRFVEEKAAAAQQVRPRTLAARELNKRQQVEAAAVGAVAVSSSTADAIRRSDPEQ